ncbi:unnamed protein product [Effrenium voratum]|uniref:Uncharacterized protein n=1 Tax=Effrenium voratum TaxID=2562239 RepID=A0AA36NFD2_9DINO|nr:unnamed protein product [Effrenium voratum]CAJ1424450.1 unnamed protein product [Effrenium voratum]
MTRSFQEYQQEKREREWKDKVQARKAILGNAERVSRASSFKEIGNEKFKCGNLLEARDYYREAIIYVEDLVDARRKERNELLVPLYSNLAQVYLRNGDMEFAEEVCGKALQIAELPKNAVPSGLRAKALFRRGLARKGLGKNEEAKEDFQAVLKLQPDHQEVLKELASVRAKLAEAAREAKVAWGGFLQKEAVKRDQAEEKRRLEQRRKERLAKAQERQQMQGAFEKLSKGKMLYEAREKEMEPVRKKEEEKKQTLELEQKLLNIIDESKGKEKTEDFDEFIKQKEARACEQSGELQQKKKVLDKVKKEEQWAEDDAWREQRVEHRKQIEAAGPRITPQMWEAKQVDRWCRQRLRDLLVPSLLQSDLAPDLAQQVEDPPKEGPVLRALVTDVLKLEGDASVIRLNPQKRPLHYFDYFLKLEWEVHVSSREESSYRTAEALISVAAKDAEQKAPASVAKNRTLGGTVKIREFSSEELPADGQWPLVVKVKHRHENPSLQELSQKLAEGLFQEVQELLSRWHEEYTEYWGSD